MIALINQWIDKTNKEYAAKRQSCGVFLKKFTGYFPEEFLNSAHSVVVDPLPKPAFTGLREAGFSDFIDMPARGITYKSTYYILPGNTPDRLHFHELVHVAQWQILGGENFIARYMEEISTYGYAEAPLEKMAYTLDAQFARNDPPFNIPMFVQKAL